MSLPLTHRHRKPAACAVEGPQRIERLGCLDRGLHELRAQVALWQAADPTVVDHAVQAAAALPQPQECATHPVAALDDSLRDRIAELATLLRSGHTRQAHEGVAAMLQLAETQNNPRALAAALLAAGRIEREAGNFIIARDHFSKAAREAGKASDDKAMLNFRKIPPYDQYDPNRPPSTCAACEDWTDPFFWEFTWDLAADTPGMESVVCNGSVTVTISEPPCASPPPPIPDGLTWDCVGFGICRAVTGGGGAFANPWDCLKACDLSSGSGIT